MAGIVSKYEITVGLVMDDFVHDRITVKAWYDGGYCGYFKYYKRKRALTHFSDTRQGFFGKVQRVAS